MTASTTKVAIKISLLKGDPITMEITMLIGDQPVWVFARSMRVGDSLTFDSVSVPTENLVEYLAKNCRFSSGG